MGQRKLATFYLDDALYGTDILQVGEVLQGYVSSPVPGAHANVSGLMNLRGQIVTVVDLGRVLGHELQGGDERKICIILKTDSQLCVEALSTGALERVGQDTVGLAVDSMGEVVDVEEKEIDPSPANTDHLDARFMRGIVKLENSLLTILSLERVLDFAEEG